MPEYVPGEKLHVAVEGVVAATPQGEGPTPLVITLDTPGGPYDVAVPLDAIAVSAAQLRSGMAVSHPGWDGDAPVRLLTVQALAAGGVEVTYEPLGDGEVGTGTAAPDARITLWDEIAGGTR